MFLKFTLVNPQTGKSDAVGYVNSNEVSTWNEFSCADDGPRQIRGRRFVVITQKNAIAWWVEESFDSVSQRILEAHGEKDKAAEHAAAIAAAPKSPLLV
jgi:hypothetical protein